MTTSIDHLAGRLPYGKPTTWRREPGEETFQRERVRDGQPPDPSGRRLTGKLIDAETVTISLEGGRRKRTRKGTSLAAYPTTCPVREGAVGFPCYQGAGRLPHHKLKRNSLLIRGLRRESRSFSQSAHN